MIWKTNLLGKRIKNLNEQYFSDWYKKSEITFYILICIVMGIIQSSNADHDAAINIRGYISHIQSTIVILMAFRYGYFGFLVSSVLIATETFFIIRECFVNFDNYLLLGLTLKLFTILIACFIAVLTNRQQIQNRKLEIMAITDELTGAYNQRFFHMILDDGIKRAQKTSVLLDLL